MASTDGSTRRDDAVVGRAMPVGGALGGLEAKVTVGVGIPQFAFRGRALTSEGVSRVVIAVVAQAGLVQRIKEDVAAIFAALDGVPVVRSVGSSAILTVAVAATTNRYAFGNTVVPDEVLLISALACVVRVSCGGG